jgi:hypothetical protein
MFHLSKKSTEKQGKLYTTDVFAMHAWWVVCQLKGIPATDPRSRFVSSVYFTTYKSLITTMEKEMTDLTTNLQLRDIIIQCCYSYCFPTPGKPERWLNFIASHVVCYQIVVFPPLLVCWWATDKSIRNSQMQPLMLPKAAIKVSAKGLTHKNIKHLKETIGVDTQELKTNRFVLKANIGCGGATVWHMSFVGNKEWMCQSIAGTLKAWPEPGNYEGERWLANAPKEEQQTFATFVKRAQLLYTAPTSTGEDGVTKYANV